MNNNKNYKLFRKHQVEIFDIIWDIWERAPRPESLSFFFGTETQEEREKFDNEMAEYLKIEEPKLKEQLKTLGFILP